MLGTASHTGAGGANVWTHELLRLWLPERLQPPPLEDLGVGADEVHQLTRRDTTERNEDLLSHAAQLLSAAA